jgi:hypothetical protein
MTPLRLWGTLALLASTSAHAVPIPPMAWRYGPNLVCATGFALRVETTEEVHQYGRDYWVLLGPGYAMGVRSDLGRLEGRTTRVTMPGLPPGERQRVRRYPETEIHWNGLAYAFPLPDGLTLQVSSGNFTGTNADRGLLDRVLVGPTRNRLCAGGS